MAASFPDPAIGNNGVIRFELAFFLVNAMQFVATEKRPGFRVNSPGLWNMLGARNMSPPQRSFIGVLRHMQAFTREFL